MLEPGRHTVADGDRSVGYAGSHRTAATAPIPVTDPTPDAAAKIGDLAAEAGIRHVHLVAWRDLDDVEAGGSEIHAAHICRLWAEAGIDVTIRTSFAQGHPPEVVRDGYRVIRRAGRYLVFPRAALAEVTGRTGPRDALVEIWNGMPFFSPLWARGPRLTFLHHVHGAMWNMVLPPNLAAVGDTIERRIAPVVYRRSRIVTLSQSSKAQLDRPAPLPPRSRRRGPAGHRSTVHTGRREGSPPPPCSPSVASCRRSASTISSAPRRSPVNGSATCAWSSSATATNASSSSAWPGRSTATSGSSCAAACSDSELVELYRSAWVLASASSHEGWGMSITEAAACGTPAVVTDIAGHRDAVEAGRTGILCPDPLALGPALVSLLTDDERRRSMSQQALTRAQRFTWGATATELMRLLAEEAHRGSLVRRVLPHRTS